MIPPSYRTVGILWAINANPRHVHIRSIREVEPLTAAEINQPVLEQIMSDKYSTEPHIA